MAFEVKEGRTLEMKFTGQTNGQDVIAVLK